MAYIVNHYNILNAANNIIKGWPIYTIYSIYTIYTIYTINIIKGWPIYRYFRPK